MAMFSEAKAFSPMRCWRGTRLKHRHSFVLSFPACSQIIGTWASMIHMSIQLCWQLQSSCLKEDEMEFCRAQLLSLSDVLMTWMLRNFYRQVVVATRCKQQVLAVSKSTQAFPLRVVVY